MAVIGIGNHPKAFWPGVQSWFGNTYNQWDVKYTDIFDTVTSSQAWEEMVETTGFGLAPVKEAGSPTAFDSSHQRVTQRFTHVAYSLGYIVTYEENQDNLYEKVSAQRAPSIAFSMRQTKEIVAANILNRAFSGSYVYGDGMPLISATHTSDVGSQSNLITLAADFSEQALEDLTIQMMNAKNNRGLNIPVQVKCLIGPTALTYEFQRVLKSTLQTNGANNDINAINSLGVVPKTSINPFLDDPDAWFLRTNIPNGMTCFDREVGGGLQADSDFDTKNMKAAAYERYSFGFGDFRTMYASPGA